MIRTLAVITGLIAVGALVGGGVVFLRSWFHTRRAFDMWQFYTAIAAGALFVEIGIRPLAFEQEPLPLTSLVLFWAVLIGIIGITAKKE